MLQHLFSAGSLALIVLGICLGYCLLRIIFDPLRDIPGPLSARFSRVWYLFAIYRGNFEFINIELHKKYGPIVRIAPNEYSIDNCEAAKTIDIWSWNCLREGMSLLNRSLNQCQQ
jgi:hypothetical protein